MRRQFLSALVLVLALAGPARAIDPAIVEQNLKKKIDALAADDPAQRQAASWALEATYYEDLPVLEKLAASANDLSPEQRHRLDAALAFLRPRYALYERKAAAARLVYPWRAKAMLESYLKNDHDDPKWDKTVRRLFTIRGELPGLLGGRERNALFREAVELADEGLAAGCDDPDFLLAAGHSYYQLPETRGKFLDLCLQIVDKHTSSVSTSTKLTALVEILDARVGGDYGGKDPKTWPAMNKDYTSLLNCYSKLVRTPGVPVEELFDAATDILKTTELMHFDTEQLKEFLFPPLLHRAPDDARTLCLQGIYFMNWGEYARGTGWGNTVTPDGWKKYAERLKLSAEKFEAAYKLDHNNEEACIRMIEVCKCADGYTREDMEKWFDRAMLANPDSMQACLDKSSYLMPKWHGNLDDSVAFGVECYTKDQGRTDISTILLQTYIEMARDAGDDKVLTEAGAFDNIRGCCDVYLRRHPNSSFYRSFYARCAALCGEWRIARDQFRLLGDDVNLRLFNSKDEADQMRAESEKRGKRTV